MIIKPNYVVIKLLLCFVFICDSKSNEFVKVKITCEKTETKAYTRIGSLVFCYTGNDTKILTSNAVVENGIKNESIEAIVIDDPSEVHFVPKGLKENFPKLKVLCFYNQPLATLSVDDLEQFGSDLEMFAVIDNKITFVARNLFRHNPNLKYIAFIGNPLKYIEPGFFENISIIKKIEAINFRSSCINQDHENPNIQNATWEHGCDDRSAMPTLTSNFTCNSTEESVCEASGLQIQDQYTKIIRIDIENATENDRVKTYVINDQKIIYMPRELPQIFLNIEEIIVRNSKLTKLTPDDFKGMTKLTKIEITNNNISAIDENYFDGLSALEVLNLSANGISSLIQNIFVPLINLRTLNLSDNKLTRFYASYLPPINKIKYFYINRNKIEIFELKALRYLKKSEKIGVRDNDCIDEEFDKDSEENAVKAFKELYSTVDIFCREE